MTLKELRKTKQLTQSEVATLIGISLRSYKQYENDVSKIDTIKYKYIVNELNKVGYIDEEHGILTIDQIKEIVNKVFENYKVHYCYLFGSYAKNTPNEKSDIDLLVSTDNTGIDIFGMVEELREGLHKKVDFLDLNQLINNKELLNEILKDGIKIYGERK